MRGRDGLATESALCVCVDCQGARCCNWKEKRDGWLERERERTKPGERCAAERRTTS
jgi:hypothetical protein